jgi:hypothetical protein
MKRRYTVYVDCDCLIDKTLQMSVVGTVRVY